MQALSLPFDPAGLVLDRRRGLSRQLYQALRQRVLEGQLGGGTRMPASRDLAAALGISRNTVMRAYDQLYAEGFIEGRVGDGTYVAQLAHIGGPAKKLSTKLSTGLSLGLSTGLSTISSEITGVTSSKKAETRALENLETHHLPPFRQGAPRAFRVGLPAMDLFPFEVWAKLYGAFWRNPDLARLGYGDPAGEPKLRQLIAAYLRSSRGMNCTAEQIVITSGAQEAIGLCAQLLLDAGDRVAIENPGYRAAAHAFTNAGATLCGVPVDNDGLDCAALAQMAPCRMVYTTPAHQYPTGVTLSLARRLALLAWAEQHQSWIIEDDYDSEYRYSGAPLAPLAALDRQGRVLYVGTFGKVAFPALRLGYLVLPAALVEPFARRRSVSVRHSEIGTQAVMAEFIAKGHFQRHIRRMRRAALSRRDTLLKHWPVGIAGIGPMPEVAAGLHLSVPVESLAREQQLIRLAEQVDVEINGLSSYWLPASPEPHAGLVLGFAAVDSSAIVAALARLREVWRS
ncbi:PLP-dependent aminotransferase family protein [Pseudomonas abieticivorans]|uniref:MocR-like pyridoxine biosynthesis transcription factor PdxR n=1 Tax=Pseudomonas abieticivorans TaxID=2931382 RepID=UPI0020BEC67D|nr:PLP-dependent aminotransferase family protein [Pseudomonas sp. PIA16]